MKSIPVQIVSSALIAALAVTAGCASEKRTELAELNRVVPGIMLDIRYATAGNFVGKALYPSPRCFLAKDAALALRSVEEDLGKRGLRLKVFDGYRPLSVQRQMWKILPDPAYVADPAVGSKHNRGYAVDVTLADLRGNDVPMPTPFDDFTERAGAGYMDLPAAALKNRKILQETMVKHGFALFGSEWWHFDYKGWERAPVLDIDIGSIRE
jgi:zinc D-Ala-D-Ala dipeptidase